MPGRWTARIAAVVSATALVAIGGVVPVHAAPASTRVSRDLGRQQADFTQHASGMPSATDAGGLLAGGHLALTYQTPGELDEWSARVDFKSQGPATGNADAYVGLGQVQNGTCVFSVVLDGFMFAGDTQHEVVGSTTFVDGSGPFGCAVLYDVPSGSGPGGSPLDAMVADLSSEQAEPLLGLKAPAKAGLVRGVPTKILVKVKNLDSSPIDVPSFVVTGHGKGVKVTKVRQRAVLLAGSSSEVWVPVKLTGRSGKVRFTVSGADGHASTTMRVHAVSPPKGPAPGTYRDRHEKASFTIRHGKVTGFHIRTQTRCGGFPGSYTYSVNDYDFPAVAIPRNGIVNVEKRGGTHDSAYLVDLRMKIAGAKVRGAEFEYAGPGGCTVDTAFHPVRSGH